MINQALKVLFTFAGRTDIVAQMETTEAYIKELTNVRRDKKDEKKIRQAEKITELKTNLKQTIKINTAMIRIAKTMIGQYIEEDFGYKEEVKEFCKYYSDLDGLKIAGKFLDLYHYTAEKFGRDFDQDFKTFCETMQKRGKVAPHAPQYGWAYVDMIASDAGYKLLVGLMMEVQKNEKHNIN